MKDRNFDDLACRFEKRIYGSLKGKIRVGVIDAELDKILAAEMPTEQLKILDIGCGLAQHAIRLASQGHCVTANDVSGVLLERAQAMAESAGVETINWLHGPFQELEIEPASQDLILCHALAEWVDDPEQIFSYAGRWLQKDGVVSLSFYNPDAKEYRNLIRGNFDWIESQASYQSDEGSLTPNQPCSYSQMAELASAYNFSIISSAGIRVFSDYIVEKRGGLADENLVLKMEEAYASREPFKWLGRYLHISLKKCT